MHRDVKPANILLADGHAWVADFGIARAITVAAGDRLKPETGLAVGTPDYMSPEQASGDTLVDGRSDVVCPGVRLVRDAGRRTAVPRPHCSGDPRAAPLRSPPSVRVVRPGVPEHVDTALRQALAKVAADRFRTVGDFLQALAAPPTTTAAPSPRRSRSTAVRVALAALVAAGAVVGYSIRRHFLPLNATRVVVFPLDERPARGADEGDGEAVATYLGYTLDGTAPLRWLDGRDFFDQGQRARLGGLGAGEARAIARRVRARYYLDGSIVRGDRSDVSCSGCTTRREIRCSDAPGPRPASRRRRCRNSVYGR